jgi:hypothetical protein
MDRHAPSYSFLRCFLIRYKELPPGVKATDVAWQELDVMPLSHAQDESELDGAFATFTFELSSFAFLRFHHYIFSVQLRTSSQV